MLSDTLCSFSSLLAISKLLSKIIFPLETYEFLFSIIVLTLVLIAFFFQYNGCEVVSLCFFYFFLVFGCAGSFAGFSLVVESWGLFANCGIQAAH